MQDFIHTGSIRSISLIESIKKTSTNLIDSNRLIEDINKTSIRSNRGEKDSSKVAYTPKSSDIDSFLDANLDLVEPQWKARHAKFIYAHGFADYISLLDRARKYGKNPRALLTTLINQVM